MVELEQLIERVKAAAGPDRELDFRIHIALVENVVWPVRDRLGRVTNPDYRMSDYLRDYSTVINSDDQDFDFPRYTTSIDAALALTERMLPGWQIAMGTVGEDDMPWACVTEPVDPCRYYAASSTEIPLALVEATLSALEAGRQKP